MLPIVSASLLAAAYLSPWLPLVSLVAFVPMLFWIDAHLEDGWSVWRRGGIMFGATLSLVILHWMYSMLWVSWLGVPCYLGLAALFTAWTTAGFMLLAWSRRATRWTFAVLLPAFWLPIECIQAQGDLRMTAQHLAHVLAGWPFLVQFADVTGPYGVGAVVLVTNGLVYGAIRGPGASRARHAFALAGRHCTSPLILFHRD